MGPAPSIEQLSELVHWHYPANRWETEEGYDTTPEAQRLQAARRAAWEMRRAEWTAFLKKLRDALPRCKVEDWTILSTDNAWRVRIVLPDPASTAGGGKRFTSLVGLISIFAPVAVTYTSFSEMLGNGRFRPPETYYEARPETQGYERVLLDLLISERGVIRLPNETLFAPVPDIQCFNVALGEARLIDPLFTLDRW